MWPVPLRVNTQILVTVPGLNTVKAAMRGWSEDRAASMGAAVAYYAVFSFAPLLLLIIAIAGLIFGAKAAEGGLVADLQDLLGPQGAATLEAAIRQAGAGAAGPVAAVVGLATLAFAATAVLAELQAALNVIWHVRARAGLKTGIGSLVKHRLLCLGLILATGVLLTASLAASAALTAFGRDLRGYHLDLVLRLLHLALSFGISTALFAMILKILPDARIEWADVWVGAAVTSLLFTGGKYLIGLYIGSRSGASVYGAAGALVGILLWVYYSTQILLFGAEITKACADRRKGLEKGSVQPGSVAGS